MSEEFKAEIASVGGTEPTNITAGDRVVLVINPTTLTGGQVLADKVVPAGKKMFLGWSFGGRLEDI